MSEQADKINPDAEGTNSKSAGAAGDEGKDGKKFSRDQQEIVDALIDRMYGKGFDKAKAEYEPKLTALQKQLDEQAKRIAEFDKGGKPAEKKADEKSEEKESKEKSKRATSEEVQQLMAQIDELREAQKAIQEERNKAINELKKTEESQKQTRIKEDFLRAAKDIAFIDPTEVFELVRGQLTHDDEFGQVVIMNPKTGRPRMDSTLENPLSLEEFLGQWANDHKHHVRASDTSGGTGSSESRRVPKPGKVPDFANMKPEEFEAYKESVKMRAQQR